MWLVVIGFFIFPSVISAAENIHIGTLEIHPLASVEQKYDDNIFLEPKHQENHDWITTYSLGLGMQMPIIPGREEDFVFRAKYIADFLDFMEYSSQDRVDHTASVLADFKFSNDFTLKIEDNFEKTADPANSELTSLEKRIRNAGQVVLGYARDKIGFDFGYQNVRDDYRDLKNLDKYDHILTTTAYYQVFPKTSLFGEYNFGKILYDHNTTNSDSTYHQFRVGIKGDIAPKLTGTIKVGYKITDYKESTKANFDGFTTFVNLAYAWKERTTVNIFAERSSEDSTYASNSYFEYNKIGLKMDHELFDRLFLVSQGSFEFNKYPEETTEGSTTDKRHDTIRSQMIGLRYEMKDWVSLETNYEYCQRDSEFDTFDYKDNRFTTKVNVTF